jgi:chromosome segregation ATPase
MLTDLVSSGSTFGREGVASSEDVLRIGSNVKSLSTGQQAIQDNIAELLALHQTVLSSLTDLPNTMTATIKSAQQTQAELLAHTVSRKDFEDVVNERISSAESERDLLRVKVDEIQAVMLLRATDAATAQARATELEEALNQSLARLKTSDVTIESQQERLLELEKLNRELISEKQTLVSKVGFIVHTLSGAQC